MNGMGPVDCPHTASLGWQCLSVPCCHPPMLWPWLYCSFVQIYPACPAPICAVPLSFSPGIVCRGFSMSKSISPLLGHPGQGESWDASVTTGLFLQPLGCSLLGFPTLCCYLAVYLSPLAQVLYLQIEPITNWKYTEHIHTSIQST